ncbi:MAG: cytochrome c oxidase assembly protein [Gammaproteobacteria bacterium]|nr:cytochrome c oxidase assembly protein [Gammaproteobacteria bacterium]
MSWLAWLAPWEFSPTVIVTIGLAAGLYLRGQMRIRCGFWRPFAFWVGLALVYAALHTRLDYYAEREFFVHRLQHLLLHHLGPFLIMLSSPGPVMRAGLPLAWRTRLWRRALAQPALRLALDLLLNPWVASILFFGIIYFWLWPSLHFIAMLDWRLYRVMNWSVTIDGLLFWWLVLDRRPKPPARLAPGVRILISLIVALPQILVGAYVTFTRHDLYPLYDLCGRAFPSISAMRSQRIGGLILWIPSAMMSVIGALVALRHWISLSSRGRLPRTGTARAAR